MWIVIRTGACIFTVWRVIILSKEIDVLKKLREEIEEYDEVIKSTNEDISELDTYEMELRDKLRGRISTLKRGRTEALRVYQATSDIAQQYEGVNDFKRFIAHIDSIDEPYTREKYNKELELEEKLKMEDDE